jgi:hypothetical protein
VVARQLRWVVAHAAEGDDVREEAAVLDGALTARHPWLTEEL